MALSVEGAQSRVFSLGEFINYFKHNNDLCLEAGQPLIVNNIFVLSSTGSLDFLPQDESVRVIFILSKLIQPLAKRILLEIAPSTQCASTIQNSNFYVRFSQRCRLCTQEGPIYTQLTDLFRAMIASSTSQVTFTPGQKLTILGLTKEELERPFSAANFSLLVRSRLPGGVTCNVDSLDKVSCSINPANANSAILTSQNSLTLTLQDNYLFPSVASFRDRFSLSEELRIPKGQTLRIFDTGEQHSLREIFANYSKRFQGGVILDLLFSYLFFPIGRSAKCEEGKQISISFSGNSTDKMPCLNISSNEAFTIKLTDKRIPILIDHLVFSLIATKTPAVTMQPHQELLLYGINGIQCKKIVQQKEQASTLLMQYLQLFNTGFSWNIEGAFKVEALSSNDHASDCLKLHSEQGMKLSIDLANGSLLLLQLLKSSPKGLVEGILAKNEQATYSLIFRLLFYYCCQDCRRTKEQLPDFLKEETKLGIAKLRKDKTFGEAINKANQIDEVTPILQGSFEQLVNLKMEKYQPHTQTILQGVLPLVTLEMQGGTFKDLEFTKLRNFLSQNADFFN